MNVLIIGITGAVGSCISRESMSLGDSVRGLVRRDAQVGELSAQGIDARLGELTSMSIDELSDVVRGVDAVVFTAGSNAESRDVTRDVDGAGVLKAMKATERAGVKRFLLVSVLPESWRERDLGADVEYYFTVKKQSDIALSRSDLDWIILRPSLLTDDAATGTVSLGPAENHEQISRNDVAATAVRVLHEHLITQQILELNSGQAPIAEAVEANIHCKH